MNDFQQLPNMSGERAKNSVRKHIVHIKQQVSREWLTSSG